MDRKYNRNHDNSTGRFESGDGDGEGFTEREADAMDAAGRAALTGAIDGATTSTHLDNIQASIDYDHGRGAYSDDEHARLTERIKRRRASVKSLPPPPGAHAVYNNLRRG